MVAWMIYDRNGARYNQQYIEFYHVEGKKLGINVKLILVEDLDFGVKGNQLFITHQGEPLNPPNFVICRVIYPLLTKHMEYMGIKVYNNSFVAEICNDKAKTYQYLAKTGIPMVDSCFLKNDQVKEVLVQINQPTVIKSVDGHGGSQVFLVHSNEVNEKNIRLVEGNAKNSENGYHYNQEMIEHVLNGIGSSDIVAQPLIGSKHQDLRVYVIGKEIIASVLRTATEGFKSNFSLGGTVGVYHLSKEEKDLVNIVINQFDFGLVGIDFIIDDRGKLILNEIEDVVGSRMLYQCSAINIVELYLKYILSTL